MLHLKYKEQEKEFEEEYGFIHYGDCENGSNKDKCHPECNFPHIMSFHKQSLITLLETLIKAFEGGKEWNEDNVDEIERLKIRARNQITDDHITYLKTELEKIKQ